LAVEYHQSLRILFLLGKTASIYWVDIYVVHFHVICLIIMVGIGWKIIIVRTNLIIWFVSMAGNNVNYINYKLAVNIANEMASKMNFFHLPFSNNIMV
ncbi:hypothetical protein ACJX0J_019038, partial [Zea mays]